MEPALRICTVSLQKCLVSGLGLRRQTGDTCERARKKQREYKGCRLQSPCEANLGASLVEQDEVGENGIISGIVVAAANAVGLHYVVRPRLPSQPLSSRSVNEG